MEESRKGVRLAQERLRQIELEIDAACRAFRRARTQVEIASDQLEELKERHWALLSFYNPNQAEEQVAEALYEFQQIEPAARLDDFAIPQQKAGEKVAPLNVEIQEPSVDVKVVSSDEANNS